MSLDFSALLLGLYGFVVVSDEKDVKQSKANQNSINETLTNPEFKGWYKEVPGLKEAIQAYVKGQEIDLPALGVGLKTLQGMLSRDPNIRSQHLDCIKAFGAYFRTNSAPALARLEKYSVFMKTPWISSFFVKDEGSQGGAKAAIRKLLKSVGMPSDKTKLSVEDSTKLKEKNPEKYKEYLKLQREVNQVWKNTLSNMVRSSGKNTIPYQEVLKAFKAKGIDHSCPTGFTGKVDALGRWYTDDDKLINGVPNAAMFPSVKMNPKFDGTNYYFQAVRADGSRGNSFYTAEAKKTNNNRKFEKVGSLIPKLPGIRAKWVPLLKKFDEREPDTVAAIVLELIFQFAARIGNPANSKTQGISTVKVKNVHLNGTGLKIIYLGKDSVKTTHVLVGDDPINKLLIRNIQLLMEDKKPADFLFTYLQKNNTFRVLQNATINKLFRACGAGEATVHKMRHYQGTLIFNELLEELFAKKKSFNDPRAGLEAFMKLALVAGKKLNHVKRTQEGTKTTPLTALQNYIDPAAQIAFFRHYNIALPKYLEKLVHEEASVVARTDRWPEEVSSKLLYSLFLDTEEASDTSDELVKLLLQEKLNELESKEAPTSEQPAPEPEAKGESEEPAKPAVPPKPETEKDLPVAKPSNPEKVTQGKEPEVPTKPKVPQSEQEAEPKKDTAPTPTNPSSEQDPKEGNEGEVEDREIDKEPQAEEAPSEVDQDGGEDSREEPEEDPAKEGHTPTEGLQDVNERVVEDLPPEAVDELEEVERIKEVQDSVEKQQEEIENKPFSKEQKLMHDYMSRTFNDGGLPTSTNMPQEDWLSPNKSDNLLRSR